jgi:hypothetical protein
MLSRLFILFVLALVCILSTSYTTASELSPIAPILQRLASRALNPAKSPWDQTKVNPKRKLKPFKCQLKDLIPGQGAVGVEQVRSGLARNAAGMVTLKDGTQKGPGYTSPDGQYVQGYDVTRPIAIVNGPGNRLHVVDAHHHLSSLMALGQTTGNCVSWENWSNLSEHQFNENMARKKWLHQKGNSFQSVDKSQLPQDAKSLAATDNPWRTVAGQINYSLPKDKPCFADKKVPYAEFYWGEYFRKQLNGRVAPEVKKDPQWINKNLKTVYGWAEPLCHKPGARKLPGFIPDAANPTSAGVKTAKQQGGLKRKNKK